ncbi:unnamed protein product [Sphagnum balticum]
MAVDARTSSSLAPPPPLALFIFLAVFAVQVLLRVCTHLLPKKRMAPQEAELVREIKELLREADALSTPSTFAKSAKLRRAAALKEKQLSEFDDNWLNRSLTQTGCLQGVVYLGLVGWYFHRPVASVPASLLQPFGEHPSDCCAHSMFSKVVGITPWLIVSTQVSVYILEHIFKK